MLVRSRARVVFWLRIPTHFSTHNIATQLCAYTTIFSDEITFICLHIFPSMHRTYMYIDARADTPQCRSKPAWQPELHTEDRLFTKSHKAPFSKQTVALFQLFCRRVLQELLFKHKITGFSENGFAYCSVLSITLCFVRFCPRGNWTPVARQLVWFGIREESSFVLISLSFRRRSIVVEWRWMRLLCLHKLRGFLLTFYRTFW